MTGNEKSVEACIELLEKLKGIDPETLTELTVETDGPEVARSFNKGYSFRDSFRNAR
ncbi:hypothetical protein AB0J71_11660 [Nonomuraea sp. NPDC049637]|uniref:hypothetical protein n=1 Tax=Nonomuraea sp. NPDC049637 TaxID=3154356 RepID=UPI0034381E42